MTESQHAGELEAYLRLNRASPSEWLAAFRCLYRCSGAECYPKRAHSVMGSVSSLEVSSGQVSYLCAPQTFELCDCAIPWLSLVLVRRGGMELRSEDGLWPVMDGMLVIPAAARFSVSVLADSQVLLVQLKPELVSRLFSSVYRPSALAMEQALEFYLARTRFVSSHQHGVEITDLLIRYLASQLNDGASEPLPFSPVNLDRRLLRAIEKIKGDREWDFSLPELAAHSGVSERNLYYLMKRATGMTPYRFYQRCRLLRVRRRLVDCQCEVPHISWYAADEGFSHLGRFAALYRDHFGELPSETVQWRRQFTEPHHTDGRYRKLVGA